jgi:hypothetical protein
LKLKKSREEACTQINEEEEDGTEGRVEKKRVHREEARSMYTD